MTIVYRTRGELRSLIANARRMTLNAIRPPPLPAPEVVSVEFACTLVRLLTPGSAQHALLVGSLTDAPDSLACVSFYGALPTRAPPTEGS